jgi:hypothetical protein
LPIFGEKIGAFLKNQCYDQIFAKSSSSLSKKRRFFWRKYFKNHNIGPWQASFRKLKVNALFQMCVDQETRTIYVFGGQSLVNSSADGSPIAAAAAAAVGQ